jgi:hypothetical protein
MQNLSSKKERELDERVRAIAKWTNEMKKKNPSKYDWGQLSLDALNKVRAEEWNKNMLPTD